ncbi:hypothetical protein N8741_01590 [Candidatus Pelagibacter sp.]|nr:hypothetical protein [Candidatus Pelagibacter sp.]MDC0442158.1 hypothetical protein [Candidatus Pelagibacter sp.]|tara:strand:- start:1256 stop:1792 length:537 start_codon:yes stop_codon:yes gene_type:complete
MKKLLGIAVLILFWCSTLYANDRYKPWVYNDVKISEKCLKHLYPLASGDWFEEYYKQYFGKDLSFGDIEFEYFIGVIGEYLNKEIPIGDKFKSSWDEEMTLTRYLDDCNKGDEFKYKVMTELPLFYCNDFAPYIENDCLSAVLIRHYSESRVRLYGMTVYGLYDFGGKLTILPLRNLK